MVSKVFCMTVLLASIITSGPGDAYVPAVVDRVEDDGIAVVEVCVDESTYLVDVYQSLLITPLVEDQEIKLVLRGTSYWYGGVEVFGLGDDGTYQTWPTVVDYD